MDNVLRTYDVFRVELQYCKSSMDRIRRRIKEGKRKAVLQGIRSNQNSGQPFKQPCSITISSLKNAMAVLPAVPSFHSYAFQKMHTKYDQDQQSRKTPFDYSLLQRMRQSLLMSTERPKRIKVIRKSTMECPPATAKHQSIRLHRPLINSRNTSADNCYQGNSGYLLKPYNPAPKVFILQAGTVRTESDTLQRPIPIKTAKRFSLTDRRAFTVPPLRKCSITGWESPDSPLF